MAAHVRYVRCDERIASFERNPSWKWPHATPTTERMARAGFFFNPRQGFPDNVTCFHCDQHFDGWEPKDDPLAEHLGHLSSCEFAIAVDAGKNIRDEDPMSEKLYNARLATFKASWPHEDKKGWKCKSKKMAEAGWCHDPGLETDDGATCFYCAISLDGWERKDDPIVEHQKRTTQCEFFTLLDCYAGERKKKPRARGSSMANRNRNSTASVLSVYSEAPSLLSLGDLGMEIDGDTMLSTIGKEAEAQSRNNKKGTKGKKGTKKAVEVVDETIDESRAVYQSILEHAEMSEIVVASSTTNSKATAKKTRAKKGQVSVIHEETVLNEIQAANPEESSMLKTKPVRGKKRTSDGKLKLIEDDQKNSPQESVMEFEESSKPKATRSRKKKVEVDDSCVDFNDTLVPVKSTMTQVEALDAAETVQREASPAFEDVDEASNNNQAPEAETSKPAKPVKKTKAAVTKAKPGRKATKQAAPEQKETQPISQLEDINENMVVHNELPVQRRVEVDIQTRADRGLDRDNSDTENVPPVGVSVLPGKQKPKQDNTLTTTIKIPVATGTPQRSPTKDLPQQLTQITSTSTWSPIKLETIFLPTSDNETIESGNANLLDKLAMANSRLSSPEKGMTVEQWLRHQASKYEDRLKHECEKMVWEFERQGSLALKVAENIIVSK